MAVPSLFALCPDGWFVPVPAGVYYQPGRDTRDVDLMGVVRAMAAVRPAHGGLIVVSDETLASAESLAVLGRTVTGLPGVTLGALPGGAAGPEDWLRATETVGAQAYLPYPPGMPPSPRVVPVDAADRETAGPPAAVRVLPSIQAAAREALRMAARLAADDTRTPLARVRDLGGPLPPAEFALAAGMVLTGAPHAWDPARVTPFTMDEVASTFSGGTAGEPDTLTAVPGTRALVRTPGLAGTALTWLVADGGRLWAVSAPGEIVPADREYLSRLTARSATLTVFPPPPDADAGLLRAALDGLPAWDGSDPDCADRVAFVLGRLGIPVAGPVPDGLRGQDALAIRFGGSFQPPGDAHGLTALRPGAVTPVWTLHGTARAHMVLVHRRDDLTFTLVETQAAGDARLRPFDLTGERGHLPGSPRGTIRLIADVDGMLLQADLRTRTVERAPAPVVGRHVDALLDPASGPRTPGMAGDGDLFPDGSATHFLALAQAAGWQRPRGTLGQLARRIGGSETVKAARDFVQHVVSGRQPVPGTLPVDGTDLYRAHINGTEVTVRAELDRQGRLLRATTPLPFEADLAGRGYGWLLTDLARAGWTVTRGRAESADAGRRRIVLRTGAQATVRVFLIAYHETLGQPAVFDHRLFRTADPAVHDRLRAEATRRHDRLADTGAAGWTAHWAELALILTRHAGLPALRAVDPIDPGSASLGTFFRRSWSMGLQPGRSVDDMLSTLVHEIVHAEQVGTAARALRTQPWRTWDIEPGTLSTLRGTATLDDPRNRMAVREWDDTESFPYHSAESLKCLLAMRLPDAASAAAGSRLRTRLRADSDRWRSLERQIQAHIRLIAMEASAFRVQELFEAGGSIRDWSGSSVTSTPVPAGYRLTGLGRAGVLIHPAGRPPATAPQAQPSGSRPLLVVHLPAGHDPGALLRHLAERAPENAQVELRPEQPIPARTAVELARLLDDGQRLTIGIGLVGRPDGQWSRHFVSYGHLHRPAPGPFAAYYRVRPEPVDLTVAETGLWATGEVRHPIVDGYDLVTVGQRLWIGPAGAEPVIEDEDPAVVVGSPGMTTPWLVWRIALLRAAEYAVAAGRPLMAGQIRVHRPGPAPARVPEVSEAAVLVATGRDRRLFADLFPGADPARIGGTVHGGTFTAHHLLDALLDAAPDRTYQWSDDAEVHAAADRLARDITGRDGPAGRRVLLALTYVTALAHGVTAVTAHRLRGAARLLAPFTPEEALHRGREWLADTLHVLDSGPARPAASDSGLSRLLIRALERQPEEPAAEDPAPEGIAVPVPATLNDLSARVPAAPPRVIPAGMPLLVLGTWTAHPPAVLGRIRAHAKLAGRPVIAADLAGPPGTVTAVVDALRDALRWYGRLGPAPMVVSSEATAHGRMLLEAVRDELRPVLLTPETAGFDSIWRLRDENGAVVALRPAPAADVFHAAATIPTAASPLPETLARWLMAREPGPAEEYHRRHADALHRTAGDLAWLSAGARGDARLTAFRTALAVARRAGGVPDAHAPRLRPAATSFLTVEPAYRPAERGPVPVTFVYDYLAVTGGRRARFPWDGLLVQLLIAGQLDGEEALSLIRATAVTGPDRASTVVLEVLAAIRALDDGLLSADPMRHPHLRALLGRLGPVTKGADCLDPIDRTAWIGRLDACRTTLTGTGDPAAAARGELLGLAAYLLSNC